MNAPHLPQGVIFVLMRQCLRFAYGGRFCGGVCVFSVFAFDGGRPVCVFGGVCVWRRAAVFFAAFCGWRRAGVRCGRFFAAVFAFFAVFVFGGGRAGVAGVFAVSAFGGGRPFFAAVCGGRPFFCGVLRLPAAGRYLRCCGLRRAVVFCGVSRLAAGDAGVFLRRRCLRFLRCLCFAADARFLRHFVRFFCGFWRAGDCFLQSLRLRFRRAFCAVCGVCVWRRAGGFSQLKSQPSDPQCCSTSAARAIRRLGLFN